LHPGTLPSLQELIALRGRGGGIVLQPRRHAAAPGAHVSPLRGRGMEFAEARPYQPGDDRRSLDWRLTARRGRPYTKLFHEERERPVLLLTDLGPDMQFGTREAFKSVVAARAAALLAWAAVAAGDRVGGVVWDGFAHRDAQPAARHPGALALIRLLAAPQALGGGGAADLAPPLHALARMARPGSLVVLISDFRGLGPAAEGALAALGRHTELALLHVYDALEAAPPPPGHYPVQAGPLSSVLDLVSPAARAAYAAPFAARSARLRALAYRHGAPLIPLATHDDVAAVLRRGAWGHDRRAAAPAAGGGEAP
jgi:uncharacterized protein (DUF58 family)